MNRISHASKLYNLYHAPQVFKSSCLTSNEIHQPWPINIQSYDGRDHHSLNLLQFAVNEHWSRTGAKQNTNTVPKHSELWVQQYLEGFSCLILRCCQFYHLPLKARPPHWAILSIKTVQIIKRGANDMTQSKINTPATGYSLQMGLDNYLHSVFI